MSPEYWIARAAEILITAYPDPDIQENWSLCESLNPHVSICMQNCEKYDTATKEASILHNTIGIFEDRHGRYELANMHFKQAIVLNEKNFGLDEVNIADTINNLGNTFSSLGKYDEAIVHFERALKIKEKAFGLDHIDTADTIDNLGSTYNSQGKYDEGIVYYERALRIKENAFGVNHINTADTIHNLGNTYNRLGKF